MLNWYIHTYKEIPDMSQQAVFILAQVLAVFIGVLALVAVIYGLVKFHTREEYDMAELKPIGFKPDGTHINKGALFVIVLILIGGYCIFADNAFSMLFGKFGSFN